ncbi:MAG: hypothetical protein ACK47B_05860 [Armatimonadota bacterium]
MRTPPSPRAVVGLLFALAALTSAARGPIAAAEPLTPSGYEGDRYEPDDSPYRSRKISIYSRPQRHSLHWSKDWDFVRFRVPAGKVAVIETFDLTDGCDTVLSLFDSDGESKLWESDDFRDEDRSVLRYAVEHTGLYYAKVRQVDGADEREKGYSLRVRVQEPRLGGKIDPVWIFGFPGTRRGRTGTATLELKNHSVYENLRIVVDKIEGPFSVVEGPGSTILPPRGVLPLRLAFHPEIRGTVTGKLYLKTSARERRRVEISLVGTGL